MGDQSPTRKLDVASYWCNDFSQGTGDAKLKYSDDMAQGFARTMQKKGHRWTIDHGSSKASPADFLSVAAPGGSGTPLDNDDRQEGVDTADFAYLVAHGGINFIDKPDPEADVFIYRVGFGQNAASLPNTAFQLPRKQNNQYPKSIWLSHKSKLGDKRLQWLIVDACESAQLPGYFKPMGQNLDIDPCKTWSRSFDGLNMLLGFHGDSTDSWWGSDRGADFASRIARGDRIADAWLDEAYSRWTGDRPVALACGRTVKESEERLHKDRLSAPYSKIRAGDIRFCSWLWWS